jgi:hypothetical protein
MSRPSNSEIDTLRHWSVYKHCNKHIAEYLTEARIAYWVGSAIMSKIYQSMSQGGTPAATPRMSEDEIADALKIRLANDPYWQNFVASKPNMTTKVHAVIDDIVCRYIAWDFYSAIIR